MDYEKFASTLKKIKIKVLFTKDKSNPNGVTDTICAYFTYMDSIDRSVNTGPSSIATVTNSLDKKNEFDSWLIFSNDEVDPVVYKEILNFALLKDDQKIIRLKDCVEQHSQKVMKLKDCVEHHTAL